ncbi:MAG: efflux RND transporter periplasmic adaptor subunit [Hyphomicrobiaceae bacterium]
MVTFASAFARVRKHRGVGFALCLLLTALIPATSEAGPGHDHGPPAPTTAAPASPRATATSERYQFVGIVEGEVMVIYLDRFADNSPVTGAKLEVTIGDTVAKAELQKNGTYEVTAPLLKKAGSHELLVSISEGEVSDLLVGAVTIPNPGSSKVALDHGIWEHIDQLWHDLSDHVKAGGWIAAGGLGFLATALLVARRRRKLVSPLIVLALAAMGTSTAFAGPGHDHGPAPKAAASGKAPQRLPDGTVFLPKPTQRLLAIRTRVLEPQSSRRAVRFVGRIIANPNRSGVVQSTIAGRYLPPPGGLSLIGRSVQAGDLMGSVAPSFITKDASDMAQTLGQLEQEIALARAKLARQERLLGKNVVAEAAVEEVRIQLDGLLKRRTKLLAARVQPEEMRAPVDGVVIAVRVVAGQVVSPTDVLFEIIDPNSLMVEALVFDQASANQIVDAVSSTSDNVRSKLRFVGRNRALQQQYSVLRFEVLDPSPALNVGAPVTITGHTGPPVTGIILPRAAIAQAPNGQMVVFLQKEPEIFEPRAIRFEPFGTGSVLVAAGLEHGDKIVIEGAPLVNQVR